MIVTASTLNVRSGPGTDFAVIRQLVRDATVVVQESHGDWRRVAPCGWVSSAFLSAPLAIAVPRGLSAILQRFGDPCGPACSAGRVQLPAPLKLGWSNASVTRVACHAELEQVFAAVFARLHARGHWQLIRTFDGIYNCRTTRAGAKHSTHSWGIAVDLNAATNRMGTQGDMPRQLVEAFEEEGFVWGGRWSGASRDPMHFQYADGY